ncbi:MAG: ROK family protein [Myxococcaceae bacterium]|nr:ROK family protein [Myxococcaceae bacterium]
MPYLGIDLGGTYARAAVVDADGRVEAATKIALVDRAPGAVVEAIARATADAISAGGRVERCGVGVAGMLEGDTGVVANAPNLGWRDVPFGTLLAERLGRPVRVVNDLSAAAWGEFRVGAGRGASEVLVVFVGSGVGSAIITGGRLVRGASNSAGEFGHVKVVSEGGRRCGCGQHGCLEAYAGGHSLIAQMGEVLAQGIPSMLHELSGGDPARLTPVLLEQAAQQGDPAAKEIYDRATGHLALAIANLVTVLNPQFLILGGGVLSRCPGIIQRIRQGVAGHATVVSQHALTITEGALGDDSGIIGAALLSAE